MTTNDYATDDISRCTATNADRRCHRTVLHAGKHYAAEFPPVEWTDGQPAVRVPAPPAALDEIEQLRAKVAELTAERDAFRDSALMYAAQVSDLTTRVNSARATCEAYKDQPPPIFQGPGLSERGEGYNAGTRDMARAVLTILAGENAEEAEVSR